MDLFPKSDKDLFRRRIIMKRDEDEDLLEPRNTKWQLQQLEKAMKHRTEDNETALEKETEETLEMMNNFLNQLEVTSMVRSKLKNNRKESMESSRFQAFDRYFKDQVMLGHTVMEKVKEFLELEEAGITFSKSFQSAFNRSYSTDMDNLKQESDGNVSNASRYSTEIKDALRKFENILNSEEDAILPKIQELELSKETKDFQLVVSKLDALQFLTERLSKDNIQPIFKLKPQKMSESHYTVSSKVFNISVDGKASEKMAAKKVAAVKMLERLVDDCISKRLPPQITPFTEFEMKEAMGILCETEKYDVLLEHLCVTYHKLAPRYQISSSKQVKQVACVALGRQGVGIHTNLVIAKRMAAQKIILQYKQSPKF